MLFDLLLLLIHLVFLFLCCCNSVFFLIPTSHTCISDTQSMCYCHGHVCSLNVLLLYVLAPVEVTLSKHPVPLLSPWFPQVRRVPPPRSALAPPEEEHTLSRTMPGTSDITNQLPPTRAQVLLWDIHPLTNQALLPGGPCRPEVPLQGRTGKCNGVLRLTRLNMTCSNTLGVNDPTFSPGSPGNPSSPAFPGGP